jgi:hypothetical protein
MTRRLLSVLALTLVLPATAAAQGSRFALIVAGASGDPTYAEMHRTWVDNLVKALRERYKFDNAHLTVLVETPKAGEDRSTAENVKATIAKLAPQLKADDLLFIMLIGHGGSTSTGNEAKFNLVGPDLSVAEWNDLLKPIPSRIALVNASSASFPFIAGLAGPNRIVITATDTQRQLYHTMYADAFAKALTADAAATDKNGGLSLLEVFQYANTLVKQYYERINQMATEHAMFDDSGDGKAHDAAGDGDGDVAGLTFLDTIAAPTSSDPEIQKLLVRQQALTQQIDELRKRRGSMSAADFDREFEPLIIELSVVSREIRRKS